MRYCYDIMKMHTAQKIRHNNFTIRDTLYKQESHEAYGTADKVLLFVIFK